MSKQGSAIRGLVFAASVTAAVPAMATAGDLRDINVGMEISSIPDAGYINLTCVGEKTHRLAEWAQWAACPAGPDQLRGIRFEYDRATAREGTMVGGHPAILTVMLSITSIWGPFKHVMAGQQGPIYRPAARPGHCPFLKPIA